MRHLSIRRNDVLFVGDPDYAGTTEMRGRVIARKLSNDGFRSNFLPLKKHERISLTKLATCCSYNTVVFLKFPHYSLIRLLKFLGVKCWFDPIDNYQIFDESHTKSLRHIPNWIAISESHKIRILSQIKSLENLKANVRVIYHHHSNYKNIFEPTITLRNVGYVGRLATFSLPNSTLNYLAENNIDVITTETGNLSSEEILTKIRCISVFVIFFTAEHYRTAGEPPDLTVENIRQLKPSQKLTLPFSLGIPTVFLPYTSYIEAIERAGENPQSFLIADSPEQLNRRLVWLFNESTEAERLELIERQRRVSNLYSLEKIIQSYKELLHLRTKQD